MLVLADPMFGKSHARPGIIGVLLGCPASVDGLAGPDPASGLMVPADLPCDSALCGAKLDLQAVETDAGASRGVSFTRGLELTLAE
jgi:hypothetical protein